MGDRWTVVDNDQKPKEKRFYYLKIQKSFWRDKAIRKLRKLPGGDTYAIIVQEICLEALESDNRLYYDGIEDSFAKELALTLDESPEAVQVAVDFLCSIGWMVEESEDTWYVPKSAELSGSISASGLRKQKQRDRERLISADNNAEKVTQMSHLCHDASQSDTKYRVIDKAIDKATEKERVQREEGTSRSLSELCPEAFSEDWEPANPSAEDVISFATSNHFTAITAEDFLGRFAPSWTEEGKRITNWRALYIAMELEARRQGEGD